jgi:hypothetical protein
LAFGSDTTVDERQGRDAAGKGGTNETRTCEQEQPVVSVSDIIGCFRRTVPSMYGARPYILRPSE